ncbi:MAG: hypothetical protein AB7P33_14215 [Dehalococcoidia bacterium]
MNETVHGPREHDEDAQEGTSLLGIVRLCWGVAAILVLAAYSLIHTLGDGRQAPTVIGSAGRLSANAARQVQPVYIGGKAFYPAAPVETPLIVHLACDQEEARIVRTYDSPPGGRALVLRLDQVPDEMRRVYEGTDPRYPKDVRIVATPCMQALMDYGDFP